MTNVENSQSKKVTSTLNKIKYNADGYWIYNKPSLIGAIFKKSTQKKITIVSPVYNAGESLNRSIDSVLNQTIGFDNIEYILVDDCSTDDSRKVLMEYAINHSNINLVFLKENSGGPSQPRNLGIKLSTSEYITFLDSDDWLAPNGIQALLEIAEETHDDYIVGKTIKVEDDSQSIVGEHQSVRERRGVDPYTVPNMFQHLGPPSKLIKTKIIKDNQIEFPDMKFAEDKQFFIDVLTNSETVSTTGEIICYINRLKDNSSSLTTKTSVMEKMDSNIKVIKHVIEKNLDVEKEKLILNRLFEFDSIIRLFDRYHFFRSDDKQAYYDKFNEVLELANKLSYDFTENFFWPIHKVVYDLFMEEKYDQIKKLLRWNKTEKDKSYIIKDGLPFMVVPFMENKYMHIEVPMLAIFNNDSFSDDHYYLDFKVYGKHLPNVNEIVFRHRKDVNTEYIFDFKQNGNDFTLEIPIESLSEFSVATYSIFLRFNEYRRITITKINHNQLTYENKNFKFYTTVGSNIALNINEFKK